MDWGWWGRFCIRSLPDYQTSEVYGRVVKRESLSFIERGQDGRLAETSEVSERRGTDQKMNTFRAVK